MRITAEKARRSLYRAAGAFLMIWLLLFGSRMISHAAEVTAITNAKVRSQASTDSDVVGSVASGASLSTSGETTGSDGKVWYQVTVGGQTGYIRSDLVSASSSGLTQEEVERENSYTETSATVSDTDVTKATVTESSVNVRKGPSSTDAKVTGLKAGAVVEVTGEAVGADGKTWYQVNADGKSGFIRADLVEASAGSDGGEESEAPAEGESESDPVAEGSAETPDVPVGETTISNVISSREVPGDVDLEDMTIDETTLSEWANGNFYLLYTKNEDRGDSWYVYRLDDGRIEKINNPYAEPEESSGGSLSTLFGGSNRIVMLIVIALFVVLILICVMLALKLREYREYGYDDDEDEDDEDDEDDDDDDDDEDEDDEDDEDDDDDEDDRRPVKKRRWSPKNFLARHDDEDDDEDEDDEDEDDEDEDEEDEDDEYLDDDDFEFEFLNMDDKSRF